MAKTYIFLHHSDYKLLILLLVFLLNLFYSSNEFNLILIIFIVSIIAYDSYLSGFSINLGLINFNSIDVILGFKIFIANYS